MPSARGLVLALALLAGCASSQPIAPPPAPAGVASPGVEGASDVPTDIRRLTILVRDMENSLKLYRDVLGLQVNYDTQLKTSGVALPAGVPGNVVRLVLLNGKDPWIGWIGLMQYLDPPLGEPEVPEGQRYPLRLLAGGHVLIADTDDAARRCEMAKAVPHVTFTAEVRLQTYPGRNGAPDIRVMGCNFFDPDGTAIELNQVLRD